MASVQNGHVPESSKNKAGGRVETQKEPRRKCSPVKWTLGIVVRLCIWYALFTPFFRCPSSLSELDASSPAVCKPYLLAKSYIEPHVLPYYQTYGAPYVDLVRPYANSFHEQVSSPVAKIAKSGYDTYGAPALSQAQVYGKKQWETEAVPRLKSAQASVNEIYEANVGPHVEHAVAVIKPHYDNVNDKVTELYSVYILPSYNRTRPIISKTYSSGQDILVNNILPFTHKTWSSIVYFINTTLWPSVTGLYSENVEPQLVKIGERLASYREGKKLRTVVDEAEVDSTPVRQTFKPTSTVASSKEETNIVTTTSSSDVDTAETASETTTKLNPSQQIEQAREVISNDLYRWQEKFAIAADKGVEDLDERVKEIVDSQVEGSAKKYGESLVEALQAVVEKQLSDVKVQINTIVENLPDEATPQIEDDAKGELLKEVRSAGVAIRDRAHALREWHNSFDNELTGRVSAAVESTLDILDSIRDLGLQEIGMRWAWMDGVTYKDWAKYHALKAQFEDWRTEVRDAGMQNNRLEEARDLANDILSRGMTIAEDAAKELTRLKEVGKWKIEAREVSDNFDTRDEPPHRPKRSSAVEEDIDEQVVSHSTASGEAEPAISEKSDRSNDSDEPLSEHQHNVEGQETAEETDTEPLNLADLNGSLTEQELDSSAKEEDIYSGDQTSTPRVWGGAAAEVVPGKKEEVNDVLDDGSEPHRFSEEPQSLASKVDDQHTEATQAASEKDSQDFTTSSSTSYDTSSIAGPLESISSVASSKLQEGLSIASAQYASVKATISPTPSFNQNPVLLDAQRRYYEAVGLAHDRYSAFVTSASEAVFGTSTPTPAPSGFQDVLESAKSEYSQVSSLISSSLAAVVASASSATGSQGQDAQSIIEDASSRYSAALSAASSSLSSVSASASSVVYVTPTGRIESVASQASENWDSLISKASEQIYGTPTLNAQQILERRSALYESLKGLASEIGVGKEAEFTERVMSKLQEVYETPYASSKAADGVSEGGSSAASTVEDSGSSVSSAASKLKDEL